MRGYRTVISTLQCCAFSLRPSAVSRLYRTLAALVCYIHLPFSPIVGSIAPSWLNVSVRSAVVVLTCPWIFALGPLLRSLS